METLALDWIVVYVPETQHPKLTEHPLVVTGLEITSLSFPPSKLRVAHGCSSAICAALQAFGEVGPRIACKRIPKKVQGNRKKRDTAWRTPEGWIGFVPNTQFLMGHAEVACPIA
jgi:hypothetical protein